LGLVFNFTEERLLGIPKEKVKTHGKIILGMHKTNSFQFSSYKLSVQALEIEERV